MAKHLPPRRVGRQRRHLDASRQRLDGYQHHFFYPRGRCPYCHTEDVDWVAVSGKGRVYTYTIVHRTADPRFHEDVPYVFAVIELEASPNLWMYSNVDDVDLDGFRCEMPVEVKYACHRGGARRCHLQHRPPALLGRPASQHRDRASEAPTTA